MEQRNHDAVLVTLADRNFIDQAKQLFSSVYWNAGWKGDYMLLAHEIPEKDLKWFRNKGILVKKCKKLWNKNLDAGWKSYPPMVLDKFYLFTPEFRRWKNIVFLDSDIIVKSSLDELSDVKEFSSVTAFRDGQKLKDFFTKGKEIEMLKRDYDLNKLTFNSGIMAFPSNVIGNDTFRKLIELLKKYWKISSSDDPILNLFFYKKWKGVSILYDIMPYYLINSLNVKPKKIKAIILHFSLDKGYLRPWDKRSFFYQEWKGNKEKADLIDLSNVPPRNEWGFFNKIRYSIYFKILYSTKEFYSIVLKLIEIYSTGKARLTKIINHLYLRVFLSSVDFLCYIILKSFNLIRNFLFMLLGLLGQFIKKINPKLYYFLKRKNGTKKS